MTLETLISSLTSSGYTIESLGQTSTGQLGNSAVVWEAQLRYETDDGRIVIQFARAETPLAALLAAEEAVIAFIEHKNIIGWGTARMTGRGLLQKLGL
jgi:hypothetical protein